jgi:hypothetical protein
LSSLAREKHEIEAHPEHEERELAAIYIKRGLPKSLAVQVAEVLAAHDEFAAHARDELGITEHSTAKPVQAALASAGSFITGGLAPLLAILLSPTELALPVLVVVTIVALAVLGLAGAKAGGARLLPPRSASLCGAASPWPLPLPPENFSTRRSDLNRKLGEIGRSGYSGNRGADCCPFLIFDNALIDGCDGEPKFLYRHVVQ